METIGFMEFNSIAAGIEAADAALKAADVELVFARAGCPGKYYLMFCGDVAAVTASVAVSSEVAGEFVVDKCVIPRVHPQVIPAISQTNVAETINAVGVMEFYSVTAAVYAADAAAKTAEVTLVEVRLGTGIGGKSFVVLTGTVAAVKESVESGINTENAKGMVVTSVVIPNPARELFESLL